MLELRYRRLKIIELGDDGALLFGCFNLRNELTDVFEAAGKRWRRKPGEKAKDFQRRILADLRPAEVDLTS